MFSSILRKKYNRLMLLKKLEVHYIILQNNELMLLDIHISNQNNNLKLIYIKISFKDIHILKIEYY